MAAVARVRLPPENESSAASATHRTRTLSHCGSDGALTMTSAMLLASAGGPGTGAGASGGRDGEKATVDTEELRVVVSHLESLQSQQRLPQQPNPEVDSLLARVLAGHPEWRPRMAVMTKSALLRKKILSMVPEGGRAVGSGMLGSTHSWRQERVPEDFTDHNWPKATISQSGLHHLPGGSAKHDSVLRCPAEKLRMDPTLSHSQCYSVPKAKRFDGSASSTDLDRVEAQRRSTPGPGTYFKSMPRGTAFADGGERVVFGANHTYPWKKALGRQINPVDVDATSLPSAPAYSFPMTRRTLSETAVSHVQQDGGAVKSDLGALSPGHVYEQLASFRPTTGRALGLRRRAKSTGSMPRASKVRCIPVPPEEPGGEKSS
mmetsp:Transcript_96234/g.299094  ORF Transcript_96234/g.299094 Transcript_96234/m.299094 type:complete len:376 (-) Transcript_96234:19-1146(-)